MQEDSPEWPEEVQLQHHRSPKGPSSCRSSSMMRRYLSFTEGCLVARELVVLMGRVKELESLVGQWDVDWGEMYRFMMGRMDVDGEENREAVGPNMYLFVKYTGKNITMMADADDLIFMIKWRLLDREGVPLDQQILLHAGRLLQDGCSLPHYDILSCSTLHMVLRVRAGMQQPPSAPSLMTNPNPEAGGSMDVDVGGGKCV